MKQSILLVTIVAIFCTVQIDLVYASIPDLTSPSASPECPEPFPNIPVLPQDNDFLCGDVTGDGLVNVLDIIALVSYIMGGSPSPFNLEAADITADDNINVLVHKTDKLTTL